MLSANALRNFSALAATMISLTAFSSVGWRNVDETHYLSGRKCSEGYLQGKVVLVCRDESLSQRMEEIWESFKTKPFALLGSYEFGLKSASYPVYAGSALAYRAPDTPLYVVDETGCIAYKGCDERMATEAVVTQLTDMESPKTTAMWRKFLDYELDELPGRACIRYVEFRKKFPDEAKDFEERYNELCATDGMKKLVELVKFAKEAKDMRPLDPKRAALQRKRFKAMINSAISKYSFLKDSENQRISQEAKNAIADLKWTLATL